MCILIRAYIYIQQYEHRYTMYRYIYIYKLWSECIISVDGSVDGSGWLASDDSEQVCCWRLCLESDTYGLALLLAAGWTEGRIERRKEGASNEIEGQRGGGGEDGRIQGSCFSDPRWLLNSISPNSTAKQTAHRQRHINTDTEKRTLRRTKCQRQRQRYKETALSGTDLEPISSL